MDDINKSLAAFKSTIRRKTDLTLWMLHSQFSSINSAESNQYDDIVWAEITRRGIDKFEDDPQSK